MMKLPSLSRGISLAVLAGFAITMQPMAAHAEIKIGIEDFRPAAVTKAQWQPLALHLAPFDK
jgi:hypothetical protein